jgi:hypothetical protein
MTLRDRYLQYRKRRAVKRHDHKTYFRLVKIIARREVEKMIKAKLSK